LNIQEYISSGIIESYLLGELSDKERAEVELMAEQHSEVKAELEAIEITLMNFAAKTPPLHIKQTILSKLDVNDAKVIALETKKTPSTFWLMAASVTLLIGSAIYNVILMNKVHTAEEQLVVLNSEKEKYAKDFENQSSSYGKMAEEMAIMMLPENKKIMLKGMEAAPTALAAVYWNQKTQDIYINVNSLPVPTADKQYQLWAIVDGKPVDAGVFDMVSDSASLQKMKAIAGAQAFAVTLEKKGGNPTPTMEAMYLLGNV